MCGIFAYVGKRKNASDTVFNGLKTLEYRGYDSWGVATKIKNPRPRQAKRGGQKSKVKSSNNQFVGSRTRDCRCFN